MKIQYFEEENNNNKNNIARLLFFLFSTFVGGQNGGENLGFLCAQTR
jgi:hypothetical protein